MDWTLEDNAKFPFADNTRHGGNGRTRRYRGTQGPPGCRNHKIRRGNTIKSFINPFDTEHKDTLVIISSGVSVPGDIAEKILDETPGEESMENFIASRLQGGIAGSGFHDPIPRLKRPTFVQLVNKTVHSNNKTIRIKSQRNLLGQLVNLSVNHDLSLQSALTYELEAIPWSIATPDGCPLKTDKATLLHALDKPSYVVVERPEDVTTVVDAGGLLHSLSAYPETFGELAKLVFEMMPKSSRVDCVCDPYVLHSIKGIERRRRGMGKRITVKGALQKMPPDFKDFLSNDGNKTDLYSLIRKEWTTSKYAEKIQGR